MEMGGKGLLSKDVREVTAGQGEETEGSCKEWGMWGDAMRRELSWKQSFRVTYLTKCWQPGQMLESLSHEAQGHMNPHKRNSFPVKVKGRTYGSQP